MKDWIDSLLDKEMDFDLFDPTSFPFLMEDRYVVALITKYDIVQKRDGYYSLRGTVVHLNMEKKEIPNIDVSPRQAKYQKVGYSEGSFSNPNRQNRRGYNDGKGWWKMLKNLDKLSTEEKKLVEEVCDNFKDELSDFFTLPPV